MIMFLCMGLPLHVKYHFTQCANVFDDKKQNCVFNTVQKHYIIFYYHLFVDSCPGVLKKQVVDKHHEVAWLEEESSLIKQVMLQFLQYYNSTVTTLKEAIAKLEAPLNGELCSILRCHNLTQMEWKINYVRRKHFTWSVPT